MPPRTKTTTTFAQERIAALLKTNADGTKQFGARDQFRKLAEKHGHALAVGWARSHIAATLEFRRLLADQTWLGFDSETTAVGDAALFCEIAFVRPDKRVVSESLIKPLRPITEGSTAIHGITNEMVADAPTLVDTHARIQKLLDGASAVLWYNGEFDKRVSDQTCFAHDLPLLRWPPIVEVMELTAKWIGDWNARQHGYRWPKLEGGHRAAGDVIAMIEAMERMASSNVDYIAELESAELAA